jgi:hypothetical protein
MIRGVTREKEEAGGHETTFQFVFAPLNPYITMGFECVLGGIPYEHLSCILRLFSVHLSPNFFAPVCVGIRW